MGRLGMAGRRTTQASQDRAARERPYPAAAATHDGGRPTQHTRENHGEAGFVLWYDFS